MLTQLEQIEEADAIYLLPLNPETNGMRDNYTAYTMHQKDPRLELLWPGGGGRFDLEILPMQIETKREKRCGGNEDNPFYQFQVNRKNGETISDLAAMFAEFHKGINVYILNGKGPSLVRL